MEFLGFISVLLSLIAFIAAFVGLIKPSILKQTKRLKAFGVGLGSSFVFFIAAAIFIGSSTQDNITEIDIAETQDNAHSATDIKEEPPQKAKPRAHGYKVIYARDHSIGDKRKGGLWYIVSPAETREDRAVTLIQAAKDLHAEMRDPDHAFVFLILNEEANDIGFGTLGKASYVPDGQGKASGFSKDQVWNIQVSDFVPTDLHLKVLQLWIDNKKKYMNENGTLSAAGEDKLKAKIAAELNMPIDEVSVLISPLAYSISDAFDYDASDYEVLAGKMLDSVRNPDEFTADPCMKSLQCWGDKHLMGASVYCPQFIERMAKYDAEWTDGWIEPKFSRFRWQDVANRTDGIVTFIGDKVKFQNGFGAWLPMTYECDFDPSANAVIDVRVFEGRL